jgi:hypothetical protein
MSIEDINKGKGLLSLVFKTNVHFDNEATPPFTFAAKMPTVKNLNSMCSTTLKVFLVIKTLISYIKVLIEQSQILAKNMF